MFLDNEYSSEVFQTLLVVPHFSNVARKSLRCSVKKGAFENFANHRYFPVNFAEFSEPPVAASGKLKAEVVVRMCSAKKVFLETHRKILVPESLFYSLGNATLIK